MPQPPRAVLWDMDGTLLDSAEYHWLAWRETLAAEGFNLTRDRFTATFGQRNDTILRTHFGPDFPLSEVDRIGSIKEARYRELVRTRGVEPLPGVRRWLARLRADGWRQAVASAAPLLNIQAILEALEIAKYLDAIVSAEDVQRGKPDPQVYLEAAARVGAPAARCIVVEDAPAGIEGARRAGMRAIGVLTSHPHLPADVVVRTLDELPRDAFDELIRDE
jgi:beta-phosphoglucomutase family hydrolase